MKIYKVFSVNTANKTGETWVTKPFHNWKKAVAKMKEHSKNESHQNGCQAETCSVTEILRGSIAQQVQKVHDSDRLKNRAAINYFIVHTSLLINILPILVTLLI